MPLTPPPDYSKAALSICVGLGLAVVLFTATRSTLPHVGDNIHHLPHGGLYKDGTKSIAYGQPGGGNLTRDTFVRTPAPLFLVIGLVLLITWLFIRDLRVNRGYCSCVRS
jgi:hypothetical protein